MFCLGKKKKQQNQNPTKTQPKLLHLSSYQSIPGPQGPAVVVGPRAPLPEGAVLCQAALPGDKVPFARRHIFSLCSSRGGSADCPGLGQAALLRLS